MSHEKEECMVGKRQRKRRKELERSALKWTERMSQREKGGTLKVGSKDRKQDKKWEEERREVERGGEGRGEVMWGWGLHPPPLQSGFSLFHPPHRGEDLTSPTAL